MPQLGRYEILQRLARGSVADVLLARASGLEGFARHVVIKQIRPEHATDTRFVSAFLDEARIGASLHHQNIVQVFDIDQVGGNPYFAMEYVHGEDVRRMLAKVCAKGQLVPLDIVVAIGAAAAAGLHYAHEHLGPDRKPLHLVHRDVSPSNILIGYDGSVKLVDFGLAKPALRGSKTRTGALCKAPYMSPELAMGKPVDRRSDLFVLGTVMYELATARRLFKGDNDFLTMAMIVEGQVPPPSTLRPDLPKDLDQIIMRALAKDPGARFQTAYDLRSALESFAIEHELRTSARAVADYLASLFGQRPEPWQDKDAADAADAAADASDDADVDFDASSHGLVATPTKGVKLIEAATVNAAAPIALAREVANGATPDPETATFDEDEQPTAFDITPDQEATATLGGSAATGSAPVTPPAGPATAEEPAPGESTTTATSTSALADALTTATSTNILADSTTTAAQPIVDVLATGQHAITSVGGQTATTRSAPPSPSPLDTIDESDPLSTIRTPTLGAPPPAIAVPSSIPARKPPPARPTHLAGGSPAAGSVAPSSPRIPAPPIVPAAPPAARPDSDAGDEATTVEPPLFPFPEPIVDARPPEEVYVPPPPPHTGQTELPPLKRWGLVGAVLLIPIVIGLIAHSCRDEAPSRPVPAIAP